MSLSYQFSSMQSKNVIPATMESNNGNTPNSICGICNKIIDEIKQQSVGCDYCPKWFHISCTNVTARLLSDLAKPAFKESLKWGCPACSTAANANALINHNDFAMFKDEFAKIFTRLEKMEHNLKSNSDAFAKETAAKFTSVNTAVTLNSSRLDNVEKELFNMKKQFHAVQRINNLNCLKILGVPVSSKPNYDKQVVAKIASFYSIELPPNSLEFCRRLRSNNSATIPPIIVRFAMRAIPESILSHYFSSAPLTLSNITDETVASRIVICEQLTSQNYKIYYECIRLRRLKVINKVSTRKGNVFIVDASEQHSLPIRVDSIDFLRKKYPQAFNSLSDTDNYALNESNYNIVEQSSSNRDSMVERINREAEHQVRTTNAPTRPTFSDDTLHAMF